MSTTTHGQPTPATIRAAIFKLFSQDWMAMAVEEAIERAAIIEEGARVPRSEAEYRARTMAHDRLEQAMRAEFEKGGR